MNRLELGCGMHPREGWVNIDMLDHPKLTKRSDYIKHDLREGLPVLAAMDVIHMSHVNEHLSVESNIKLLSECHKLLKPGGRLYLDLPDFHSAIKAYFDRDWSYFNHPAILHFAPDNLLSQIIDYSLHQRDANGRPEHISFLDSELMLLIMRKAGFSTCFESVFCEGISNPEPLRVKYSIYFEGIK